MYICGLHNFKTDDIEAWDLHCYSTGHVNEVENKLPNGKWEKVTEPYPRHHMRDIMGIGLSFGPFSKENPPSPELLQALEDNDIAKLIRYKLANSKDIDM